MSSYNETLPMDVKGKWNGFKSRNEKYCSFIKMLKCFLLAVTKITVEIIIYQLL